VSRWLNTWFGWIPIFHVSGANPSSPLASSTVYTASAFIAGVVVAMMVMPIQCVVMREVFSQVPVGEREGAFALGSTRWGMIRFVSLPFGRGGIIGGTMLGLGRALGETIAVLLIISPRFDINSTSSRRVETRCRSLVALRYGEASGFGLSALMAAGLALFAVTLLVNFTARGSSPGRDREQAAKHDRPPRTHDRTRIARAPARPAGMPYHAASPAVDRRHTDTAPAGWLLAQ